MKLYIVKNEEEMSDLAAKMVSDKINSKPNTVLGLATGSTPEGMYKRLVELYEKGEVSFKEITTFNLDEYCGLDPDHEQSYHYFMRKHLLSKVDIDKSRCHIPQGVCKSRDEACRRYDEMIIDAGGIDLQILGIGVNGHIGFNEPGDKFVPETHVVELTKATLDSNSRFFEKPEMMPKEAITMGMRAILSAKAIILLACGESKAEAIKKSLLGPVTPEIPASILQLHRNLTVIVDEKAGKYLK